MADSEDPDQMHFLPCLIWVYTACSCLAVLILRVNKYAAHITDTVFIHREKLTSLLIWFFAVVTSCAMQEPSFFTCSGQFPKCKNNARDGVMFGSLCA